MVITVFLSSFICSFICFKLGARWQRQQNTKVGTPSASHNSAMLEIALILREFVADSSEHGITDTEYYWQKIDAVVAQLQQ